MSSPEQKQNLLAPPASGQIKKSVLLPDGERNDVYLNEPLYHHAFKPRALSMPDLSASLALANFDRGKSGADALLASEFGLIPTQDEIRNDIEVSNRSFSIKLFYACRQLS